MFDDWEKRRELRKKLSKLVWIHSAELRKKPTEAARQLATAAFESDSAAITSELYWMDTAKLIKRAKRYGVASPPHGLETGQETPFWHTNNKTELTYLTDNGIARLRHETTEAILNYWKRWVEIVSPIVAVLIALFALAVSILALYLQLSNTGSSGIPPR